MKSDVVFLSYAKEDSDVVRKIHARLRRDGFEAWLDEHDLVAGQEWDNAIRRVIRSSKAFVLFLSPNAVSKTGYIQKEIREALDVAELMPEGRTFIIPAKLLPCDVPERLQRWQWVDMSARGGFSRLETALRVHAKVTTRKRPKAPKASAFASPIDQLIYDAIFEAGKLYFGKTRDGRILFSQNHFSVIRRDSPKVFKDLKKRIAHEEVTADEIDQVIPPNSVWRNGRARVIRVSIPRDQNFVILESNVGRCPIRTRYWRIALLVAPSANVYVTGNDRSALFEEAGEVVMAVAPAIMTDVEREVFDLAE